MAGVKVTKFLGKAPRIASELLPDTAAQVARNCKLYSGDLIPYPRPLVVANSQRTGPIRTIYGLRDPITQQLQWLSWDKQIDIAIASETERKEQRFYYTGDGVPKVSDYRLATTGPQPYPVDFYELGLPLPEVKAEGMALPVVSSTVATYERDNSNSVILNTTAPHNLRTGNVVTISGFTTLSGTYSQTDNTITVSRVGHGFAVGAAVTLDFTSGDAIDGSFPITTAGADSFTVTAQDSKTTSGNVSIDLRTFNATNVEIAVLDPDTITYFSPGPAKASAPAEGAPKIDLSGQTQIRNYVYTWFTPWEEESIASSPSTNLFIKEGVQVDVTMLPSMPPPGKNYIRGIRLYRTLPSISGTEYFRLQTLWFPVQVASVARTTNIATIVTAKEHNLTVKDRFKIGGMSPTPLGVDFLGTVKTVVDDFTFTVDSMGADIALTVFTAGTLFHDVSENPPTTAARYWGDGGNFTFRDDFDSRALTSILDTDEYDAPPKGLQGLTAVQNNFLAGFVDNVVYFSELKKPHAWPRKYAIVLEHNIVALAAYGGNIFVMTDSYPYVISGSDPATQLAYARIDVQYPCLNRAGVVTLSNGIVYPTHEGLAVYAGSLQLLTRFQYNSDTWNTDLLPNTLVAEYFQDMYFGSHAFGAIMFSNAEEGGSFVDIDTVFSAAWFDAKTNRLYYAAGLEGDIFEWNNLSQPALRQNWKSKTLITQDYLNMGAARVVADYGIATTIWDQTISEWQEEFQRWDSPDDVTFNLYVDKKLKFSKLLKTDEIFRMPTGYREDTYEVEIISNVRIRSIHMAETPLGLKAI